MNHLDELEQRLRQMLRTDTEDAIAAWVKARVLQSYRNGQERRYAAPAERRHPALK